MTFARVIGMRESARAARVAEVRMCVVRQFQVRGFVPQGQGGYCISIN